MPCSAHLCFNCSDQMNYQTLAAIFKGLSQTGAWGCDEFNRIKISVLIVATQVQTVQEAVKKYSVVENREEKYRHLPAGCPPFTVGKFNLQGDEITLMPTVGIWITMNPGYAGRTELPENLKALFRSCAMIRPDLAQIAENMLMAEGLQCQAAVGKPVTLYTSSALRRSSPITIGDFVLRSVLVVAGGLKRASPEQPEEQVLMRALLTLTLQRFQIGTSQSSRTHF